jgi:hypothetical protein
VLLQVTTTDTCTRTEERWPPPSSSASHFPPPLLDSPRAPSTGWVAYVCRCLVTIVVIIMLQTILRIRPGRAELSVAEGNAVHLLVLPNHRGGDCGSAEQYCYLLRHRERHSRIGHCQDGSCVAICLTATHCHWYNLWPPFFFGQS